MGNIAYGLPTATPTRTDVPDIAEQRRQLERNLGLPDHIRPGLLPPVQENIQSGQKTATPVGDVVINRNSSINPDNGGSGNLGLKWAFQGGTGGAASPLISEMQGEFQWYTAGIIDRLFGNKTILENSSPSLAQKGFYEAGSGAGLAVKSIPKIIKDSLEKVPRFEIPKIQVPKFSFPQLPKFDIPKIPEFNPQPKPKEPIQPGQPKPTVPEPQQKPQPESKEKDIPRLKEPAPKPIPKSLIKQLRDLELSPCGSISFGYATVTKVLESRYVLNDSGGYHLERITVPATIEEVYNAWVKYNVSEGQAPTLIEFIESGGGTGQVNTFKINQFTSYDAYYGIGGLINSNQPTRSYPFNDIYYPYYSYGSTNIAVKGVNNNLAINAVLDHLSGGYAGEVYKINVSQIDAKDCPIGKPPLLDPPPPPPEDCDCMAQCCPDIDYRKIQAMIEEAVKKLDVTAAVPLSWQIRHEGDKPQMVIQCAERKSAATAKQPAKYDSAKYPITVPHWKGGQNDKPSLPPYKKGNWEGILVLADNSKVTINAKNEAECIKILNAIKPWIDSNMLEGSYFKGGKITTKEPIKETQVFPQYGRYFEKGQKNSKPDWRVDFP